MPSKYRGLRGQIVRAQENLKLQLRDLEALENPTIEDIERMKDLRREIGLMEPAKDTTRPLK